MSEAPLSVALVGIGRWGRNYLRLLAQARSAKLAAVVDVDPAAISEVSLPPSVNVCASLEEAIATGVDGVIIATPSSTHAQLAMRSLELRKPLLIEKPLATTVSDARAVASAAKGIPVVVGHLMLHHPAVAWLRSLVRCHELGELRQIRSSRVSRGAGFTTESALWALGAHDVCLARHLVGAQPDTVAATPLTIQGDSTQELVLRTRYSTGLAGTHLLSRRGPSVVRWTEVVGSRGVARIDEVDGWACHDSVGRDRVVVRFPEANPLSAQLDAWTGWLRGRACEGSGVEEGVAVVEVLAAAERSAELGLEVPVHTFALGAKPWTSVEAGLP